jgi:hypothetical protein
MEINNCGGVVCRERRDKLAQSRLAIVAQPESDDYPARSAI